MANLHGFAGNTCNSSNDILARRPYYRQRQPEASDRCNSNIASRHAADQTRDLIAALMPSLVGSAAAESESRCYKNLD
jgi:SAM-dependent methyltransferase